MALQCNTCATQLQCNVEKEIEKELESEIDTDLEKKSKTVHVADLKNALKT